MLERTLARIRQTCRDDLPEVVLCFDGDDPAYYALDYPRLKAVRLPKALGTSAARHVAVMHASHDAVFTCDAHMEFLDNGWAEAIRDAVSERPSDVFCCKMVGVGAERRTIPESGGRHTGANLCLRAFSKNGRHTILSGQWANNEPGPVPLVMGACYAFSRRRYVEEMRCPMSINRGWGQDEHALSLVNWICGGETRLLDVEVGHYFGISRLSRPPVLPGVPECWPNLMSLLGYLPMSDALRSDLFDWAAKNPTVSGKANEIEGAIWWRKVLRMKEHLAGKGRTLDEFAQRFGCPGLDRTPLPSGATKTNALFNAPRIKGDSKTIKAARHFCIVALPRSGSNAVAAWISSQLEGRVRYQLAANKNKTDFSTHGGLLLPPGNEDESPLNIVYTLEGANPRMALPLERIESDDQAVRVVLLRDPRNWVASMKRSRHALLPAQREQWLEAWIAYAEEFKRGKDTGSIPILYDRWFSDRSYREELAGMLRLPLRTDAAMDLVQRNGIGGSSFDGRHYDGRAGEMDVLNRYRIVEDEKWYRDLMEDTPEAVRTWKAICGISKWQIGADFSIESLRELVCGEVA